MWDDEDTRRWSTDAVLLEVTRQTDESEGSSLRRRPDETVVMAMPVRTAVPTPMPAPIPAESPPAYAASESIRALFDGYVRVLGPAAKAVFAEELRAIGAAPSRVPVAAVRDLIMLLAYRIPAGGARERFVEESITRFQQQVSG